MKVKSSNKIWLIAALAAALGVMAMFYSAWNSYFSTTQVVVAARNLSPYLAVDSSAITSTGVPTKSVTKYDLTWKTYQDNYVKKGVALIPLVQVLAGQRVETGAVATTPQASFSIVKPDERIVAVTTSSAGAALGAVAPGDVVDVQTANLGGTSAQSSSFAKVLCISTAPGACNGVLPGQKLDTGDSSSASTGSSSVKVLLAVDANDAPSLAGATATLAVNPYCGVDQYGSFISLRKDAPCQVPQNRLASIPSKQPAPVVPAPAPNTGTTTTATTATTTAAAPTAAAPATSHTSKRKKK